MSALTHRLWRQDSFSLALVASLLAHLLLLFFWGGARELHLVNPFAKATVQTAEEEKRLQFELVETPPDAITERPTERTNLLSDKSTKARDLYTASDKPKGEAYSDGQSAYRTFAGGGVAHAGAEAGLMPPYERVPGDQEGARQAEPLAPGVQHLERGAATRLRERFSPEVLSGNASRRPGTEGFGSDDLSYRNVDFSAEELGGVTLNTYAWDFAPYLLEMKRRIRQNIYPPPAFTRLGIISGETVLRFRVLPDGQMTNLEVLGYTGHPSLKETSVIAVKNSAPFKPLPKGFPEDYLELTWTFIYSVTRP